MSSMKDREGSLSRDTMLASAIVALCIHVVHICRLPALQIVQL